MTRDAAELAELKRRIRELWDAGMSTAAIGAALGETKNVIVGHAHRMKLASRPSPIIRDGAPRAPKTPREHPASVLQNFAPAVHAESPRRAAQPMRSAAPKPEVAFVRKRVCDWPMWPHGARAPMPPTFCGAPVADRGHRDGRPVWCSWCAEHAAIGLVRSAPRYATDAVVRVMEGGW